MAEALDPLPREYLLLRVGLALASLSSMSCRMVDGEAHGVPRASFENVARRVRRPERPARSRCAIRE